MKLTGQQYRAIGAYAKKHKLKLALSAPPYISFLDGNELKSVYLDTIINSYENAKREDERARAQMKKIMGRKDV